VAVLAASLAAGSLEARAQEQTFDHMTCVKVNRDERLAKMPRRWRSRPSRRNFSTPGKPVGGGKIARADEICYPTAKDPTNPPNGTSLRAGLPRYRVARRTAAKHSEHSGDRPVRQRTIFANERPV
jgi:hypothetical protein